MKILITGASGFIGSFIVEEALRRGFNTLFREKFKMTPTEYRKVAKEKLALKDQQQRLS